MYEKINENNKYPISNYQYPMSWERKFQIQNCKFQINYNAQNHKYQKSTAGSGSVLTAVPSRQSFHPRGQAPWGIILRGQFVSGGQSLEPRGQAPWRFMSSLRFAPPTGLVPVACMTDYQKNNVNKRGLHGACPRGYHDWPKIRRKNQELGRKGAGVMYDRHLACPERTQGCVLYYERRSILYNTN